MTKLSSEQIASHMSDIPGWELNEGERRIDRTVVFSNFKEAISFVNHVAEYAEEADHHPDISIQYNQVKLTLTTHDVGGLTGKDFALAQKISRYCPPSKK